MCGKDLRETVIVEIVNGYARWRAAGSGAGSPRRPFQKGDTMRARKKMLNRIAAMLAEIKGGRPNPFKKQLERIKSNSLSPYEQEMIKGIEGEYPQCFGLAFCEGYPEYCDKWGFDVPGETPEQRRHRLLVMKQLKLRGADCYYPPRADLEAAEAAAREEEEVEAKLAQGNPKPQSS